MPLQQIGEPGVACETRRARAAARHRDKIECRGCELLDRGVRPDHDPAAGLDRAFARAGADDLELGPPEQIDQGDGFELLAAVGEGDKDACFHADSGAAGWPQREM